MAMGSLNPRDMMRRYQQMRPMELHARRAEELRRRKMLMQMMARRRAQEQAEGATPPELQPDRPLTRGEPARRGGLLAGMLQQQPGGQQPASDFVPGRGMVYGQRAQRWQAMGPIDRARYLHSQGQQRPAGITDEEWERLQKRTRNYG